MPTRTIKTKEEFNTLFEGIDGLDATESPKQRPKEEQKNYYSGKKKAIH